MTRFRTAARLGLILFWLACAGLFGFFYYVQYFQWRGCFNELGRCYDSTSGVVYLEQSGAIWLTLTLLALAGLIYQIWRLRS